MSANDLFNVKSKGRINTFTWKSNYQIFMWPEYRDDIKPNYC